MPGPKPSPYSLKRTSVKKAFYIDKSAWGKLESYFKRTGKEKSHVVNEALQLYIEQMFDVSKIQSSHWSVVSLFSGCGGMDLGFSGGFKYLDTYYDGHQRHFGKKCDAAFKIIFANDILSEACQTYESYFRNKENDYQTIVRNEDIKEFLDRIESLTDRAHGKDYFMQHLGTYITFICDSAARHHVMLNQAFISAALAVKVQEGIALALDPTVEVWRLAIPVILEGERKHGYAIDHAKEVMGIERVTHWVKEVFSTAGDDNSSKRS